MGLFIVKMVVAS